MMEPQGEDNPITSTDTSREVARDYQEHVTISDGAAATQQEDSSSSSSEEDAAPQSKADILAAAGVSINLDELQMLQAEQAPLELVTEVSTTRRLTQTMIPNVKV